MKGNGSSILFGTRKASPEALCLVWGPTCQERDRQKEPSRVTKIIRDLENVIYKEKLKKTPKLELFRLEKKEDWGRFENGLQVPEGYVLFFMAAGGSS